ncbi:deoxyribonuclease NucA/NucB-domain-containing protein [Desarmillaria tabescens]|uniref:Deoxyribonuclease NucA/NucB-domain-containing protein n=1 Tax=Armillaria tabescens TaxID=1929756 RepID=A0AA39JCW1_ARMTA|nr:deoxyribonuclease NucA/NucB-domain-containing protein [Desarmillaria tabescens]KAK0439481.1 deoxyribonuclease NucA/NucB-domain-containing protein [Desarmillaria tabescens]
MSPTRQKSYQDNRTERTPEPQLLDFKWMHGQHTGEAVGKELLRVLDKLFIVTCLFLLGVHALPTELSNATATWSATATKIVERAGPTFTLDYRTYPQSSENICFSWFCNNGSRSVAPDLTNATTHRASNSCGNVNPNRCSVRAGHASGYQCDEWHWANSNAGGANAATRCIPTSDNTGSGSQWGNFINICLICFWWVNTNPPVVMRIQNRGSQAVGRVLRDRVDFARIEISNVPTTAEFCLGVRGTTITATMCNQQARGQPHLQRIG